MQESLIATDDRVGVSPSQDQHVVRARRGDEATSRFHRNRIARTLQTVSDRVVVDEKIQLRTEVEMVEDGGGADGRSVTGDGFSIGAPGSDFFMQLGPRGGESRGESRLSGGRKITAIFLVLDQVLNRGGNFSG